MKYLSTRGGSEELSFEEAVLQGLAPNGGLYIPTTIPSLPKNWQSEWKDYSFVELSVAVLSLYISRDEVSKDQLTEIVTKSYAGFRHPLVTPLKKLDGRRCVLELWHGPTWAFKDVALQFLGNLFEFFLERRNAKKGDVQESEREKLTVIGATSGDTGSAAIYGLRNKANLSIFILHPKGRVSPIQEAQMTTITDPNVHNLAVKGTFDDCQDIVKALFSDVPFNAKYRLGAVNSINWARILAQTVYYFSAYFQLRKDLGLPDSDPLSLQFVVPTGNFGDILAGFYARKMGLPVNSKLGVATNANDILARFWKTGRYEKVESSNGALPESLEPARGASDGKQATDATGGVKETYSPAMDILVSSNFERLLWYLAAETTGDKLKSGEVVDGWMSKLKSDGRVEVPREVLESARQDFCAERVTDTETLETIRNHYLPPYSYAVDPHTGVGLCAAAKMASQNDPKTIQIILSTAHPAKFSQAVSAAMQNNTGFDFERDIMPKELKGLLSKPRHVVDVEGADVQLVKDVIVRTVPA